jgi:lauroyl/myristoyl acyltransferase
MSIRPQRVSSSEKPRLPLIVPGDLEYVAVLVLATGLNVLPSAMRVGVIHQLSQMLGTIWYKTNQDTVRRVRHYLQHLFGYEEADTKLESLVRSQLVLASWNAIMINLLPSLRNEHLAHLLQVEGLHYLGEIRRQNKAILLLGFHYGAYGFAVAVTLSAQGYPTRLVGYGDSHSPRPGTSYLYHKLYWPRVQNLNRWVKSITIDPGKKSQPELCKILEQKNETVYLLADQYFVVPPGQDHPSHLVPLRLLNHTVYLDVSGVQLAKQMEAQALTAIPVKDGYHQRVLIEPMGWASDGTAPTDIAQDLQIYMARLEQRLLEYPALWRDLRRSDLLPRMGVFECKGSAGE